MGYPIFHSQYTAAQIEASIGKTPRIKAATRTWEIWDIATSAYVDTGVSIDTEIFVDDTLSQAGYAADAAKTGELKSAITQPVYAWTLGKNIDGTGKVSNNNYTAITDYIPCSSGDVVIKTGAVNDGTHNFVYYINQFANGEWQSRKTLTTSNPIVIDSTTDAIRIGFGRASSSGVSIQQSDIDTYFGVFIYRKMTPLIDFNAAIASLNSTKQDILTIALNTVTSSDCNNINMIGAYYYGSSDNAANTPGGSRAGLIIHYNGKAVGTMYQFAVDYTSGAFYKRQKKSGTWGEWIRILSETDARSTKYPMMKYVSSPEGPTVTERIYIYVPATVGYIEYRLYHMVDSSNNCNGWQIYNAYHTNDGLSDSELITRTGEWECAIRLENRDDASGGHTHGDELMNNFVLLLDGAPVDYTQLTSVTPFKKLRVYETTMLYDPADHITPIAKHGREWVFDSEKMVINQSLEWLVAEPIEGWHMAMFPPLKTYVDRAIANTDFEVMTLASDTESSTQTYIKPDATGVQMYDTDGGLSANVSVPVYPTGYTDGDFARITDNSGLSYNKLYFTIAEGGTSVIGDKVKTTTVYQLDYA